MLLKIVILTPGFVTKLALIFQYILQKNASIWYNRNYDSTLNNFSLRQINLLHVSLHELMNFFSVSLIPFFLILSFFKNTEN